MKLSSLFALLALVLPSNAAVVSEQFWTFDNDSGNNSPANSGVGSSGTTVAFTGNGIGTDSIYTGGYLHLNGTSSSSGMWQRTSAGQFTLPSNLFGVELWIRTDNPGQTGQKTIFRTTGTSNCLSIAYNDGGAGISVSKSMSAYIGTAGQFKIDDGAWHSLAIVALSGSTKIYWDGAEMVSSSVTGFAADLSNFHLGIAPGGASTTTFNGDIDNLRYFTFASDSDFNPATDLHSVPEPSTYALVGGFIALGFALVMRRQKNRE